MKQQLHRESGSLLVELLIALTILVLGLLGFLNSMTSHFKAGQDLTQRDEVRVALENLTEIFRTTTFSRLYADYNGASLEIPYLTGADGSNATVEVMCHVDETALPAEFGPILDIDGTGGLENTNASVSYKILPVQLTINYLTSYGTESRDVYLILRG